MTLDEARKLVRVRGAEYEGAKLTANNLATMDVHAGLAAEYHVACAERDRALALLREAQLAFVNAERIAPESATDAENISAETDGADGEKLA